MKPRDKTLGFLFSSCSSCTGGCEGSCSNCTGTCEEDCVDSCYEECEIGSSYSCDCDGKRTCSIFQWCQGVSRAKNKDYYYNEDLSNSECDPQSPLKDFYCNSNRICDSKGKCIDPIK